MLGLSFEELWDGSRAFRVMLSKQRALNLDGGLDTGLAEAFWDNRFPRIDWDFCGVDGCVTLVKSGEKCSRHAPSMGCVLPGWQWTHGRLYRYVTKSTHIRNKPRKKTSEYIRNDRYVWRYRYGDPPRGFRIRTVDGNPFNHRIGNLFLISRYSAPAYDLGIISAAEALKMDESLPEVLIGRLGGGRKSGWVYGLDAISNVAGVRLSRVRQAVSRGELCPGSLLSVVDFCKKHRG